MSTRAVLLKGVANMLTFSAPEAGSISGATVIVYDAAGAELIPSTAATIADSALSISLTSDQCANVADNLRALWSYTVGGSLRRRNQPFDIVAAILYPTVTTAAQLARRYPILEGRDFRLTAKQDDVIAEAWADILQAVRAKGRNPHRIIDPTPLEAAHKALAASYITRSYRPGGQTSPTDWGAFSEDCYTEYQRELELGLAAVRWYDADDDLKPEDDEIDPGPVTLFLSR